MIEPSRYPIEPLAEALGITLGKPGRRIDNETDCAEMLAIELGVTTRTIRRYRQHGLTSKQADHYAVHHTSKHPAQLWPAWFSQQHVNDDCGELQPPDMHEPDVQPTGCTTPPIDVQPNAFTS